jgi:hypothetical protein
MKLNAITILAALAAKQVAAHSIFQQLWVNGVDMIRPLPVLMLRCYGTL